MDFVSILGWLQTGMPMQRSEWDFEDTTMLTNRMSLGEGPRRSA